MREHTQAHGLTHSAEFRAAKEKLLQVIQTQSSRINGIRGASSPEIRARYLKAVEEFGKLKGREQYYNYLASGLGHGPYIELLDGSVKLDLINGIGINFFGHSHPELMSELIDGAPSDTMQGNLQPGYEAEAILRTLLQNVGPKSRLKYAWTFCSGTMANENAIKIIRQKKFPASRIFAFQDAFAGRSTVMAEVTDSPGYRVGQPVYGEVFHLPFYDAKLSVDASAEKTIQIMQAEVARHPTKYAGLMIELVQGEGGIRFAPREWYVKVFEAARKANLAIWADEIQTFGRTTELFAYQTFGLDEYVDMVTVGKLSHACFTLYTEEMNPKPGLVAGTFSGSAAALNTGRKVIEMLTTGGYYGPNGKIAQLSKYFVEKLDGLKRGSCAGQIGEIRAIGGMIGFGVLSQSLEDTKKFLMRLFDEGVIAFYAGHDPYLIRILPPFGILTTEHIDEACLVIEKVLKSFKT